MAAATEAIGFRVVRGPKLAAPKPATGKPSIPLVTFERGFLPLKPKRATGDRATFEIATDGSLLVKTRTVANSYTVQFETHLKSISGFQIEMLLDDTLPEGGPGLATKGRIAISEIRLRVGTVGSPNKLSPVEFANASATSSDHKYPVGFAFDGNNKTLWVPSQLHRAQKIIVRPKRPINSVEPLLLEFKIDQRLAVGKFRISATSGAVPAVPVQKDPVRPSPIPRSSNLANQVRFKNTFGMSFVRIPAGEFMMGSPASEEGRDRDESQHRVKLTKPFMMGVTEVTRGQWKAVMGVEPNWSAFKGEDLPVEQVSWEEAVKFCEALSKKEGRRYRLPTEAEWEYACRAGTTGAYAGSGKLDEMGWHGPQHKGNSGGRRHRVGQKKPNAWGLYDMHGNVWEWCSDWFQNYPDGDAVDPKGPINARSHWLRVTRGGGYLSNPALCRSASRNAYGPKGSSAGLRLVLELK